MMSDEAKKARNEYQKKWREKNRERLREYHKKWRKENKEKVNEAINRYWEKRAKDGKPSKKTRKVR